MKSNFVTEPNQVLNTSDTKTKQSIFKTNENDHDSNENIMGFPYNYKFADKIYRVFYFFLNLVRPFNVFATESFRKAEDDRKKKSFERHPARYKLVSIFADCNWPTGRW